MPLRAAAAATTCDRDLQHSDSRLSAVLLLLLAKMALSPLCWVCAQAVSGAKIIWDTRGGQIRTDDVAQCARDPVTVPNYLEHTNKW